MSGVNAEMKAEIDGNGPQQIQGGHNGWVIGVADLARRERFGGPGGRPRDDMRVAMRQDVSKHIDLHVLCIYV